MSQHIPFDRQHADTSQMKSFAQRTERRLERSLGDYATLHRWACDNYREFWREFLTFTDQPFSGENDPVYVGDSIENGVFFPRLRINYTECLLRPLPDAPDRAPALVFRSEAGNCRRISRGELRHEALAIAAALRAHGIRAGDRVVAMATNTPEAVEACLAAAALGATWSSVGPELAASAAIARFAQLEPLVLFIHTEVRSHGVQRGLQEQVRSLVQGLPTLRLIVLLDGPDPGKLGRDLPVVPLATLLAHEPLVFEDLERFPFNQPLFVLFTSGTTGAPKCVVHGAGGTLLEHLKEHRLHSDLRAGDRLYFHTSCGWMMWNWQLTALASGVTLLLFDGSVSYPDTNAFLKVLDEERITVFGTSPAYLQLLREAGTTPRTVAEFAALRLIQSTGSILYDEQFDWIREAWKAVPIHSISGGSDIIGCFVLGNPLLPVYRGESQCISLGLDVRVITDEGSISTTGTGELVCVNPFPSRPVGIWGDAGRERFHSSYFAEREGIWTHGDRVHLSEYGSARILGRSDGTMKIRGVRIGPAELYTIVLAIPGVREAMAVELEDAKEPGGRRIVLLVVLAPDLTLDRPLALRIKRELSQKASPVHVPSVIWALRALPQTHNGKYSERAARDIVNGRTPKNLSALRNPECLDELSRCLSQLT